MISRHADSVHFSGYITRSGPNQFKIEFHDSPVFESKIIFAFKKKEWVQTCRVIFSHLNAPLLQRRQIALTQQTYTYMFFKRSNHLTRFSKQN